LRHHIEINEEIAQIRRSENHFESLARKHRVSGVGMMMRGHGIVLFAG